MTWLKMGALKRGAGLLLLTLWGFSGGSGKGAQAAEAMTIAGGSVSGVYFHVAQTLCGILNKQAGDQFRCSARSGSGSVFNVNALRLGIIDYGLVQSDRNWQAWNGFEDWQGDPAKTVRSLFALHDEAVHLVARVDSGIKTMADLRGKRVNIGNVSSGQRGNAQTALVLFGLDSKADLEAVGLPQANALTSYEAGELDAFFYTVGVPAASITKVTRRIPSVFVPLDFPALKTFMNASPPYTLSVIPAGSYTGITEDVPTFALKATMMTAAKMPDDAVYTFVKAVFDHLDQLRASHPALAPLTPENMLQGLTAPLHPGAVKYYREQGWMD